jgi:hypothetical protein
MLAPLAVCVVAMGWCSSAQAARGMEVALQDDTVFVNGLVDPFKGLRHARELNVTWIRANVTWKRALGSQARARRQPRTLRYNFRPWDDLITRAAAQGIKVELTLTGPAPRWATGDRRIGIYKPNASKFGAFARAAAQHFNGRVERFLIWNEPNLETWLLPVRSSPRLYRSLYVAAYKAIKGVNPNLSVFIGETAPFGQRKRRRIRTIAPLAFLRGVTCVNRRYRGRRCPGLKTDGYAHHPYDYRHKPTFRYPGKDNVTVATLGRLTSALSKLRKARALTTPSGGTPFVYLTEYGYFAAYKFRLPQRKQAAYLKQGFQIAQRNSRVKQMLQYLLVTPRARRAFFQTQIMTRRFKPLRAFTVLKAWAASGARRGAILKNPLNP